MTVEKITMKAVAGLAPGNYVSDTIVKGFGARRQTGGVFYYLRYRRNGTQFMKSIGRHGSPWTCETARNEAKRLLGVAVTGNDPFAKPLAAESFGKEVKRYLHRKRAAMKPRSFEEVKRHLTNHAAPLHRLRATDIDRRAVASLLGEIESANGPIARNRVRSSLSAFFAWAVSEGLLNANPVQGTAKLDEGGSRERVLTQAELIAIWQAVPKNQFGDIVRLLLLTGQRREEIGGLRWSEIDFDRRLIVFPAARTKNCREHALPSSRQSYAILRAQPRRKDRDLIFGYGNGGFSGWSDCKSSLDKALQSQRGRKAMPEWRLHDLRRTAATMMMELGTAPHVVEAVLNHVSGSRAGVAGIYNRAKLVEPMREALQKWADFVEEISRSQ